MNQTGTSAVVTVDPSRAARWVAGAGCFVAVGLVLADYFIVYRHLGPIGPFREIFWLTDEETIGTWFAATQTLLVGLTLAGIAIVAARVEGQGSPRVWWLLSGLFVYLSADDAVQIHESIGTVVELAGRRADGMLGWLASFPTYHWQLVFGLPLLALAYLLLGFAAPRLAPRPGRRMLFTAVILLASAVVLDFLEGLDSDHPMNLAFRLAEVVDLEAFARDSYGVRAVDAIGHFQRVVEEFLEIAAMTLLLGAFVAHLATNAAGLRVETVRD